jgi:hypothetical protein
MKLRGAESGNLNESSPSYVHCCSNGMRMHSFMNDISSRFLPRHLGIQCLM